MRGLNYLNSAPATCHVTQVTIRPGFAKLLMSQLKTYLSDICAARPYDQTIVLTGYYIHSYGGLF